MKRKFKQEESTWVDVHNNELMDSLGFLWRKPAFVRDPSVWTKTAKEKKAVKRARNAWKNDFITGWGSSEKHIPLYGTLIIQIKNDKNFRRFPGDTHSKKDKVSDSLRSKFTFSHKCWQHEIPRLLAKYSYEKASTDRKGNKIQIPISVISKYKWNDKWYAPQELPFAN